MRITLFCLLCFFLQQAYAQTLSVTLLDADGVGVPFANIYASPSSYGTVSDVNGIVHLELSSLSATDTLHISCIGFEDQSIAKADLIELPVPQITLTSRSYVAASVDIVAERAKFKRQAIGSRTRLDLCQIGFELNEGQSGQERGILIKNDQSCYLSTIHFNMAYASHDSMLYEVNLYRYEDGTVKEALQKERIFIQINKSGNRSSIDVRDQYIEVEGDFLVSFEAVDVRNNGWFILFKAKCKNEELFFLKGKEGTWRSKREFTPSIWCKIDCLVE